MPASLAMSIPTVGSSSTRTSGSVASARASSTRCCWPVEIFRNRDCGERVDTEQTERAIRRLAIAIVQTLERSGPGGTPHQHDLEHCYGNGRVDAIALRYVTDIQIGLPLDVASERGQ